MDQTTDFKKVASQDDRRKFFSAGGPDYCVHEVCQTVFLSWTLKAASLIHSSQTHGVSPSPSLTAGVTRRAASRDCCGYRDIEIWSNRWVKVSQQEKVHVSVRLESGRQTVPLPACSVGLIDLKGNECWHIHTVSEGTRLSLTARGQLRSGQSDAFVGRRHFCVSPPKVGSSSSSSGVGSSSVGSSNSVGAGHRDHVWIICLCWNSGGESSSVSTDCRSFTGTWKVKKLGFNLGASSVCFLTHDWRASESIRFPDRFGAESITRRRF